MKSSLPETPLLLPAAIESPADVGGGVIVVVTAGPRLAITTKMNATPTGAVESRKSN